ncbi:MAG: YkvA family protein [Pseudomonadota bacterium]
MSAFEDAAELHASAMGRERHEGRNASSDRLHEREENVRRNFWRKLKRVAGNVPFVEDLIAAYYCAMDPATPMRVRGMLLAALAYFILPLDLMPDIIAGLGFADDMALLTAVIGLVSASIKPVHRAAAARALDKELPPQQG